MLKSLILLSLLFVLSSCASKDKKEEMKETTSTEATKTETEASTKTTTEETAEMIKSITCVSEGKNDTRLVEIASAGNGCRVFYTKNGIKKSVAQSKYSSNYCETVVSNIQKNLVESNFTCQ